ncbi:MAG: HTTM domain-containing protein, partial [Cyanobacteria bacterium]|nr:HTTM domain-containing protein [Cyanobacteriota bacterium]
MNDTQESSPEQYNGSLFTRIKAWVVSHYGFDGRSIALFRMGLAFIFVVDIINRSKNIEAFYTDEGVLPRIEFINDPWPYLFSLNLAQGSSIFQGFLFMVALVAGIGLFGGYRTKICNVICWILISSIHSRNSYITHAGDWLLNNLLFLSLFIPLGKYYSLDLAFSKNAEPSHPPQSFLSIPCLAVAVQLAILYIYTALIKTDPAWANGNALFYSLHNELYSTSLGQMLL